MKDVYNLGIKGFIKNKYNKVLLLKVNVKQLKNFSGDAYWDIPGGRIQRGETAENAMKREIYEETGIREIEDYKHLKMFLSPIRIPKDTSDVGLILSVYEVFVYEVFKIKLSEEHVEAKWFNHEEACDLLSKNPKLSKEFVDILKESKTVELNNGKLVRDNIIKIIEESGRKAEYKILNDQEYKNALVKKLYEEIEEYIHFNKVTELADLEEVILSLSKFHGISQSELEKLRLQKKEKNGGFEQKIFLLN